MKLLYLFGPQAVGKMAIGMKIAELTGYRLVHNHSMMEVLAPIFGWGNEIFKKLDFEFYFRICEELAQSEVPGVVLTKVRILNSDEDNKFVEDTFDIFRKHNIPICQVELYADLEERIRRNNTPLRLKEKPSKRNLKRSTEMLHKWHESDMEINSNLPFGLKDKNYLNLDTTKLSLHESAQIIIDTFNIKS